MQNKIIENHKVNPANDKLDIEVMDEPGPGGAHHHYRITGALIPVKLEGYGDGEVFHSDVPVDIIFQNGPINEVGVNGLTHEALLSIVAHRLQGFQAGPYACEANQIALEHVLFALETLKQRTIERMNRGVEGTHKP